MAGVILKNITKSFGSVEVLKGVSIDINDGEFMTLVGPSGCGKSTLLRIIAGLETQDEGEVWIGNYSIHDLPPRHRDVAMVFQSYALYPHLTVGGNITLPLRMRKLSFFQRFPLLCWLAPGTRAIRAEIMKEAWKIAEMLGIQDLWNRKPRQLSGGQRQRVAVGRALVRHPQVFLMDEPLSNLDAALRVQMRMEIAQLHGKLGVTFIYVTHDQVEAMTMSDRMAVMMDGEIIQIASSDEIYKNPSEIRVAEFIGSPKINILPGKVIDDKSIEVYNKIYPAVTCLPVGTPIQAGVRPEALIPAPSSEGELTGQITFVENLGSELSVHAHLVNQNKKVIAKMASKYFRLASENGKIHFVIPQEQLLIFDKKGRRVRHTLN
jgi:multiple sugar transport system ATP-binding protein